MLAKCGFEVKKAFIYAILRDWRKGEVKKYNDYPLVPFFEVPIPLWSTEEQETFINDRIQKYKEAINFSDEELPLCTPEERWQKQEVFAVYKNNNKTATRLFPTENEANQYILELGDTKNKYSIQRRPGLDIRCIDYCSCNKHCSYWQSTYGKE